MVYWWLSWPRVCRRCSFLTTGPFSLLSSCRRRTSLAHPTALSYPPYQHCWLSLGTTRFVGTGNTHDRNSHSFIVYANAQLLAVRHHIYTANAKLLHISNKRKSSHCIYPIPSFGTEKDDINVATCNSIITHSTNPLSHPIFAS